MDDPHVLECRMGLDLQPGTQLSPRGERKIPLSWRGYGSGPGDEVGADEGQGGASLMKMMKSRSEMFT